MKVKNLFFEFAVAGSVVILSSCGSTTTVSNYSDVKYRNITGIVTNLPVVANLNVKPEKVQGVYRGTGTYSKDTKSYGFNEDAAKNLAVQDAIEKYGADILLEPMFSITTVGGQIEVTVTGYVATYSGFRNATKEDAELLQITGEKSVISGTKVTSK
ncbi:MAG: hypothetical protein LBH19_07910 [Dysgonamonadaceae bacterium]|jgi:hypothetical protein|nr:hypothetical protein [Dysgonamonadaceae bacterium]